MQRFLNAIKAQSAALDGGTAHPRFALVSSVDPATYTVRVLFQPENVLSGWLPVLSLWGASGWGLVCPPTPGQQVLVVAQEGEAEHGVVLGVAFSQSNRPPPAPSGELWLMHQSGSFLKLSNDGTISGKATKFMLAGDVQITGNVLVTGDISDTNNQHGTLAALRAAHNTHTHVDSRGGLTSVPSMTV